MKSSLLLLFGLVSSTAIAADYELTATIQDFGSTLAFPTIMIPDNEDSGQSTVDNCTYTGIITEQADLTLLLQGKLACENGSDYDLPEFTLLGDGGEASITYGETETPEDEWIYSVNVKVLKNK
ncbi:hypothetical protein [Shewanella algae]|uniref:hypothetical protein n=1 Tax=Shewanella algae TaxID=38313 RepID=UPI0006D10AB8|nr:hypothetical protein [Shewanella algae]QGS61777.1 hypothetical protein GMX02_20985 [Shewanella algae]